jgi:MFS family permease
MIILGVISWFILPRETLLKSGDDAKMANREVMAGMSTMLRLPEVWLAGGAGFTVFMAYTSMPFFLTYLKDIHALPVLAISIFGIASTSGGRIGMALPSGFIADKFLGGAAGGMRLGLFLVVVFSLTMALLPAGDGYAWPAMITMMLLACLFFFMRALYFAPFGEMGLPQRFSGSVIAIAAFIIYLPASFAYLLWGILLDNNEGVTGYSYLFAVVALVALTGVALAHLLQRRIRRGASLKIAEKVRHMDQALGLQGKEKTLSDLIDAR